MMFNKRYEEWQRKYQSERVEESYRRIMDIANIYMNNKPITEQLDILNYLIKSILDDVCTSVIVEPLVNTVNGMLPNPFPKYYFDEYGYKNSIYTNKKIMVDLSNSLVYVRPFNNKKTFQSLKMLIGKKFIYQDNHMSDWYSDIGLCYVYNGNHSINAGRYLKDGTIYSEECKTELLYPHCTTDGLYWYNKHNGEKMYKVSDFRLAAVYSLAQIRYFLPKT